MAKKTKISSKTPWEKVKAFWNYVWNDDSPMSWVLSIVIAFIIIKFMIYPLLGLLLSTSHPIVAIVSGSMEHKFASEEGIPSMCGVTGGTGNVDFTAFWNLCGSWYEKENISKKQFDEFPFKRGMNTGDIVVLRNPGVDKINVGDVIVYNQNQLPGPNPIIHRVVHVTEVDGHYYFQTKGDHNGGSAPYEMDIYEDQVIGKSLFKIPLLGYVKIWAYDLFLAIRGLF